MKTLSSSILYSQPIFMQHHQWDTMHDTQLAPCQIKPPQDSTIHTLTMWSESSGGHWQSAARAQPVWWEMETGLWSAWGKKARGCSSGCLQLPWGRALWWRSQTPLGHALIGLVYLHYSINQIQVASWGTARLSGDLLFLWREGRSLPLEVFPAWLLRKQPNKAVPALRTGVGLGNF